MTEMKCPDCGGQMKVRNGKFGQFLGCAKYPYCCGIRGMDGTAKRSGTPPVRKDEQSRIAYNKGATKRIAERALVPDGQSCPFDGEPRPNDIYTSFKINGVLISEFNKEVVDEVHDIDREFRDIMNGI